MSQYELPVCPVCLRPPATKDDWDKYAEGEGDSLCWDQACHQFSYRDPAALLVAYEVCSVVSALLRWCAVALIEEMEPWYSYALFRECAQPCPDCGTILCRQKHWPSDMPMQCINCNAGAFDFSRGMYSEVKR